MDEGKDDDGRVINDGIFLGLALLGKNVQPAYSSNDSSLLEVAEKVCDHVFIIDKGKILFDGKMEELKKNTSESLEQIFLELVSNE